MELRTVLAVVIFIGCMAAAVLAAYVVASGMEFYL